MTTTTQKKRNIISALFSFLCAVFMSVGHCIDSYGELKAGLTPCIIFAVTFLVLLVISHLILGRMDAISSAPKGRAVSRPPFPCVWAAILVMWIPVFLAEFPGFFVYDAVDEYVAVATRTFTTHHPLLHTLLLGGCVYGGEARLHSANAGIAIYVLAQMAVVSGIFAWRINRMAGLRIAAICFYGLFPTVVMFALCSAKDTLFAAALLACVTCFADAGQGSRGEASEGVMPTDDVRTYLMAGASLTVAMLMRHNAAYAVLVFALAETVRCLADHGGAKSKARFGGLITIAASFLLYLTINLTLTHVTGADASLKEHQEMLTVPIQQVARTWQAYGDEFSPEELNKLYCYLPEEGLAHYTPCLSDPVKSYFDNAAYEADPSGFWSIWGRGFRSHPMSYVNAWLNTCYGYFYPFTVVNVYEGHAAYTFTYDGSSYFGYEVEYPGERRSLIPFIDSFYRWLSLDDDVQRIPVISLFFSMGSFAWFYMLTIGIFTYRGEWRALSAYVLTAAVWATLLLGPTFLPRYVVFLWFMLPDAIDRIFLRKC